MGKSGMGGAGLTGLATKREALAKAVETGTFRLQATTEQMIEAMDGTVKVSTKVTSEFPDFTPAVNKGAALLDLRTPGWFAKIDTSALNLDDENMCVLGQTWSHYRDGLRVLNDSGNFLSTNFSRLAKVLAGESDASVAKRKMAEYGFAFADEVYAWCHVAAAKDLEEKKGRPLSPQSSLDRDEWAKATWKYDKLCWEQLTKTWLVLIEARQKAQAQADAEKQAALDVLAGELGGQPYRLSAEQAGEIAGVLYKRGFRTLEQPPLPPVYIPPPAPVLSPRPADILARGKKRWAAEGKNGYCFCTDPFCNSNRAVMASQREYEKSRT